MSSDSAPYAPAAPREAGAPTPEHPSAGQRLGLPPSGPGSMAGLGRRVLALCLDWFAASVISGALVADNASQSRSWMTLAVFALEVGVLTWLTGASFGQRIVGLRVRGRVARLTLTRTALRTVLICLVIPAVVTDSDGRGLHDRAVDSVVVLA